MTSQVQLRKQFNWRYLLVRLLVSVISLLVVALIVPKIYFVERSLLNLLLISITFGILNVLIKPILQFLTLPFIFVTYGAVVALINALILLLLAWMFPDRFAVNSFIWAIVGGLLVGILGGFLDALLGLTRPIIPNEPVADRRNGDINKPVVQTSMLGSPIQTPKIVLAETSDPIGTAVLPAKSEVTSQTAKEKEE